MQTERNPRQGMSLTAAAAILIIRVQLSSMQTLEHSQRAEHCPRTLRCKCRLRTTLALSRGQQRPTQQQLVQCLMLSHLGPWLTCHLQRGAARACPRGVPPAVAGVADHRPGLPRMPRMGRNKGPQVRGRRREAERQRPAPEQVRPFYADATKHTAMPFWRQQALTSHGFQHCFICCSVRWLPQRGRSEFFNPAAMLTCPADEQCCTFPISLS